MTARATGGVLVVCAVVAGTLSDRVVDRSPLMLGGYHVMAADFHDHPILTSAWDLVLQARREHLDAVAITPHNEVFSATIGRWFSRLVKGPIIIVGEEVRGPRYHLIALGISQSVTWRQPAAAAIAAVHRQGGIAIAAHPRRVYWPAYDADAVNTLDGAEVMDPAALYDEELRRELANFFRRAPLAAIGSSDYHGIGRMGMSRTYVFAADASEGAILDALRHRRTVVYDGAGRAYGDPALVQLGAGQLPTPDGTNGPTTDWLVSFSRIAGIIGLLLLTAHD